MTLSRRTLLVVGGGAAASLLTRAAFAAEVVEIVMEGTKNGARVWFDPVGLLIAPGTTVRWTNNDKGNSHTSTAYRSRVPEGVRPWDSRYLLPGKTFEMTFETPGVYDYYCTPHKHAGMVGRILVGAPDATFEDYPPTGLTPLAEEHLPAIADIVRLGAVPGGQ